MRQKARLQYFGSELVDPAFSVSERPTRSNSRSSIRRAASPESASAQTSRRHRSPAQRPPSNARGITASSGRRATLHPRACGGWCHRPNTDRFEPPADGHCFGRSETDPLAGVKLIHPRLDFQPTCPSPLSSCRCAPPERPQGAQAAPWARSEHPESGHAGACGSSSPWA